MTSCVDRLFRRTLFAGMALAFLALVAADGALAQAPPAAVDQYKPAPPGITDPGPGRPDPGRPAGGGNGGGDGAGGGGAGSGATAASGTGGGTGAGTSTSGGSGGGGSSSGAGAGEGEAGAVGSAAGSGAARSDGTGPVVGGYPLTSSLAALIAAIAIGLCAAGGVAVWRRRRAAALAGSS